MIPEDYRHDAPNATKQPRTKGYLLYFLPSPLILKLVILLFGVSLASLPKLLLTAGALFFFYSGAHLTRTTFERLKKQPPNRPNKIKDNRLWAAIYIAVGVLILTFLIRRPTLVSLVMTTSAFIGYYLCYGLPKKQASAQVDYDGMPEATRQAIKDAYQDLQTIENLAKQLNLSKDKDLSNSLNKVIAQSYVIMGLLVEAPEDAGRARKFLNVYINRIKEILKRYIKLSQHDRASHLRQRLIDTLNEIEHAFREKKSALLDDDIFQLDIQLEVLNEQIKHED